MPRIQSKLAPQKLPLLQKIVALLGDLQVFSINEIYKMFENPASLDTQIQEALELLEESN